MTKPYIKRLSPEVQHSLLHYIKWQVPEKCNEKGNRQMDTSLLLLWYGGINEYILVCSILMSYYLSKHYNIKCQAPFPLGQLAPPFSEHAISIPVVNEIIHEAITLSTDSGIP